MNIYDHALLSQHKFKGDLSSYLPIHSFIDSSKLFRPDFKHRILLHNSFGAYLAELKFGLVLGSVPVRDIVFEHCKEDLDGYVPTLQDWFQNVTYPLLDPLDSNNPIKMFCTSNYHDLASYIWESDFGLYLYESVFKNSDYDKPSARHSIKSFLDTLVLTKRWQRIVDRVSLDLIAELKNL